MKFEFDNAPEHKQSSNKNAWLVAICLLWTSTNLAHLPWYLNRASASIAQAREHASQVNLERNIAFAEAAQAKQLAVNSTFDAEWAQAYNAFGTTGSTPVQ